MGVLDVLIVTHGRASWLRRCLLSLHEAARACPTLNVRITIGLNGDDPSSVAVLKELKLNYTPLTKTTPAAARSQLLPGMSAEWLLFIDDDAFVEPTFFQAFCASLLKFPQADAIGGPNLTHPGSSRFQLAVGKVLSRRFATFTSVARFRPLPEARPCDDSALMLCNLFVRGKLAREVGFPADLNCAEENWLLTRMREQQRSLIYDPALWAWHERRENFRQLVRQVFNYGRGRGQQLRMQPQSLRLPHLLPSVCLLYALGFGLAVAFQCVPQLALAVPVLAYLLLSVYFSLTTGASWWLGALLFPAIHVSYGAGVIFGLILGRKQP